MSIICIILLPLCLHAQYLNDVISEIGMHICGYLINVFVICFCSWFRQY